MNKAVESRRLVIYEAVRAAAAELYGQCPDFTVRRPKSPENGDFTASAALALGSVLRRPPIETAKEIVARLKLPQGERALAVGKGYINFFLKPDFLFSVLQPPAELSELKLPNMDSPYFQLYYSYTRLKKLLTLHGETEGADFSLLASKEEKRLLWAIAEENLNELSFAAMDFYDKCSIYSDYPPLKAARCILLNNALRVMELHLRKEQI